MKPSNLNRLANVIRIIAFIVIYGSLPVIFCCPNIGFFIFVGGICLGALSTFNEDPSLSTGNCT